MIRAVVFDLWDTLVDFDVEGSQSFQAEVAERLGHEPTEFAGLWEQGRPQRDSGTLRPYLTGLGLADGAVEELLTIRHASTRTMLAPRPGAVETLVELRDRGLRTGLISVCSEDVPTVWPETPFDGLFDSTVFSCSVGLRKPDPRIYRLALDELGIEPEEAIFVGDGANDELAGAARVGMHPVLIHRPGQEPLWEEARAFTGPRITSVPQVLDLLG